MLLLLLLSTGSAKHWQTRQTQYLDCISLHCGACRASRRRAHKKNGRLRHKALEMGLVVEVQLGATRLHRPLMALQTQSGTEVQAHLKATRAARGREAPSRYGLVTTTVSCAWL